MCRMLRFFRPSGRKIIKPFGPFPTLVDENNLVVSSYSEKQKLHQQHFAKQEVGRPCETNALCQKDMPASASGTFHISELPTLFELEQIIREAKDGKSPGPSGVPVATWKSQPKLAARALYPIVLKSHTRLCEPIQNRGYRFFALFKKVGLAAKVESYRSIALLDPAAKFCTSCNAQRLSTA